jgi:phosphatidylglycerol:prolipoprotein diacylglycerol transferase
VPLGPAIPLLLAESTVHTLDPVLLRLGDALAIRWYGMAYLAGFVVAWFLARMLARRGLVPLRVEQVGDFMTACVVGVVVGGRLGHVLFYDTHLLWTFHAGFPFWGVLDLHKGGMSSHGGMLGTLLAMAWFARAQAVSLLALCDLVCFCAPPGLMFGRVANWVNGELWGRVLPASMQANPPAWSVKYPEEALDLAAALSRAHPGNVEAERLLANAQALYRDAYAGSAEAAQAVAALVPARYPSQFFQAFTDGPVLFAVMVLVWLRPRRAGTLLGAFFMAYGVLRLATEQFREPDEGVFAIGPATLPMLLSGAMVVFGAAVLVRVRGSQGPLVGGLLHPGPQA